MTYILGISLGYNASACIMDNKGNVCYAASEERFTNIKNCKQFPLLAIKNGIEFLNIDPRDFSACRYSHYQSADVYDLYRHSFGIDKKLPDRNYPWVPNSIINMNRCREFEESFIAQQLYMLGIEVPFIERINHHLAHAACSYVLNPYKYNNLYVVMDGFGDGETISAWVESDKELLRIYSQPMYKSIGLVYQFVTGALGYKEHQHEGKITGLAAYGDPKKYYQQFVKLYESFKNIKPDYTVQSPITDFDIFSEMKIRTYDFINSLINGLSEKEKFKESKDIAASLQAFTEDKTIEYIKEIIAQYKFNEVNLCLSGGLFANVKINQRVHENIKEVKNIFIAPPMGDEGTCIGAACGGKLFNKANYSMTNMTMRKGTSHWFNKTLIANDDELMCEKFSGIHDVAEAIAKDLSENKIVCLFDGQMEFGPRALIGRSIMYNCRDVGANDWLNKQLGRTEFMPFAPFCKEEHAHDLFHNVEGKEYALKNMTITVNCKDEFIQNYPAACHVDNTARPQVISADENKLAWAILDTYEKMMGEKALINTSFNLHNYPIIESPEIAISSWKQSNTHSLYIGKNDSWYKITRK